MVQENHNRKVIQFNLRYMAACTALIPLATWAFVREQWIVFWSIVGLLLLWTYLVLPATFKHADAKSHQFGPRDVLFWLIVIGIAQAWWVDHKRLTHVANEQKQMSDHTAAKWADSSERQARFVDFIRPPSIHRSDELYKELTCKRCGVQAGDKSPGDLWYGWQARNDEGHVHEAMTLCNECAAGFGVMGQDQTRLTLEKKWNSQVGDSDSRRRSASPVPPSTPDCEE